MESAFSGVFKITSRYLKKCPAIKGCSMISGFSLSRVLLPRWDIGLQSLTIHRVVSSVMCSDWLSKRIDPIGHFQVVFCPQTGPYAKPFVVKCVHSTQIKFVFEWKVLLRTALKPKHKGTRKWLITALGKHKNRNIPTIIFIALDSYWKNQSWYDLNKYWCKLTMDVEFLYRSNLNYDQGLPIA